tara:strand:- start:1363 stop:2433 length:1071 start_codon:yes stop_codon:yes gene_type:complete
MKKLFTLILLTLISISCTDNDTVDVGSEIIPDRNVYVAGYIIDASGNSTACYWLNGKRVDLGPGQLEDIVVSDGKVYAVGWTYGASASYWIDNESFDLEGSGAEAYSIAVHEGDVYTAGRDNGACYWKNTTKNKLSGGDSSGYGIAIKENGDVFIGGYYMNNHHYVIPARWKNGNRSNLTKPSGGDGEVLDVKIYDGTPYYFGMSMAPNSMLGYLPKVSYWKGNTRNDMPNGGGWQKGIYGGESYGGFVDETGVYVAGKIDWIGEVDDEGNDIPGTGGTYAHYWHNGTKVDLLGGVFNDMWVSTAYDVAVSEGYVVVTGDVATETQTQVPAIWVNDVLTKLEGDNTHGVAKAVFID